jgi:Holliday junction resolvase
MTTKKLFKIVKWNGDTEYFQPEKLKNSLRNSGASPEIIERILSHVEHELQDGMKTSEIYQHAFDLLKTNTPVVAARYDLKRAIMRLGPSGYPFEKFIGNIWKKLGYKVQTGVMAMGKCIEHEVDVIAENAKEVLMMECKYHNFHDTQSDVKTALYVHARMQDLEAFWKAKHTHSEKKFKGYLVTNTKLSSSAIQYAQCAGLNVIAWSYPKGQGLAQIIDKVGLHPITCLTTLTEGQVKTLLNQGSVLCRDVMNNLNSLHLSPEEKLRIQQEAVELCQLELPKNVRIPAKAHL